MRLHITAGFLRERIRHDPSLAMALDPPMTAAEALEELDTMAHDALLPCGDAECQHERCPNHTTA
jgi:hypothetical protein